MKIEELHIALKDKTTLQFNAIANEYIGKEYIIELVIFDINEGNISGNDSSDFFLWIVFDQQFKNQLMEYSRGTKVTIKARLRNLNIDYNIPYYKTTFNLVSISKA